MEYAKMVDIKKILVGDIVFTNTKSLFSRIINIVQRGSLAHMNDTPSHTAIVTAIYANKVILTEAALQGVRLTTLDRYNGAVVAIKRIKAPLHMHEGLVLLNEALGTKYDYTALIGILARSFWRLFGDKLYQKSKRIRNFLNSKTSFFCSELVYIFIQEVTEKKPWDSAICQTTPWDIVRSPLLGDVE